MSDIKQSFLIPRAHAGSIQPRVLKVLLLTSGVALSDAKLVSLVCMPVAICLICAIEGLCPPSSSTNGCMMPFLTSINRWRSGGCSLEHKGFVQLFPKLQTWLLGCCCCWTRPALSTAATEHWHAAPGDLRGVHWVPVL